MLLAALTGVCHADPEFRGAWVTGWSAGFLAPDEADETIRQAKAANMNALIIQVRKVGDAYYFSDFEPRATNIRGPQGYDPLEYVIKQAHEAGLEVHAWINTLRVQLKEGSSTSPYHVANAMPGWLTRSSSGGVKFADGLFLDPGVVEVQEYILEIVRDILSKYNVDGLHLDYIRYPDRDSGYNRESVNRFNAKYGRSGQPAVSDPQWSQWRRDQVTTLVRSIYREAGRIRPDAKVTAATIVWGDYNPDFTRTAAYNRVYQDWPSWMREGILDAAIPMNYRDELKRDAAGQYRRWLEGMTRWQYGRHIYAGQKVGSNVPGTVSQLQAGRSSGLAGMVCFTFNATPERNALVSALRGSVYAKTARTPGMPWKDRFARAPGRERYDNIP